MDFGARGIKKTIVNWAQLIFRALSVVYRYLDSAQMYGNESDGCGGVDWLGKDGDGVLVLIKIHPENCAKKDFLASVEESLRKLALDCVDRLFIHWPHWRIPIEKAFGELMMDKDIGLTRFIGVSNFNTSQVLTVLRMRAEIVTNQVAYHFLIDQQKPYAFLPNSWVSMTAYSLLAHGQLIGNPVLMEVAARHGRTDLQVAFRWLVQQENVIAIPRSASAKRLAENLEVLDFELPGEDKRALGKLSPPSQQCVDWHYSPVWN